MSETVDTGNMWSRRRAAVKAEAEAELQADADALIGEERATLEAMSDEEALAELELPDPDKMEAGSDFSAFMKSAVPDRLRRRALRKLWLTNPVLANVDNLVDYGEDFTISTALVENIQTIYRVGKGMLPDEPDQSQLENEGVEIEKSASLSDGADDGQVNVPEDEPLETTENSGETGETLEARAFEGQEIEPFEKGEIAESVVVQAEQAAAVEQVEVNAGPEVMTGQFGKRRMRFEFAS